MRQGQEAKSRAASDVNLAQAKSDVNQQITEASQGLKEQAVRSGLNVARIQNDIANQAMSRAIQNMQSRQSAVSSLGSAIGQGAGAYFGRQRE
jgi:hypothetical protein